MESLDILFKRRRNRDSYNIDKIECDFQAKLYDLRGNFDIEEALEDIYFYGEEAKDLIEKVNCASDVWIDNDKKLYKNDKIFESLIEDIQKIKEI